MGPPLTSSERRRKFVENLKLTGNYDAFKQKRAEYERARRERAKASLAKLSASQRNKALQQIRLKNRAGVQRYREKNKRNATASEPYIKNEPVVDDQPDVSVSNEHDSNSLETMANQPDISRTASDVRAHPTSETYQPKTSKTNLNFEHPYNTNSALLKAVSKARKALPMLPSKRKAVIAKLLYALDEESQMEIFRNKATRKRIIAHNSISPTLVQEIRKFYERDDISHTSTKKRDRINFVNPFTGEKRLTQLRHLKYKLKEVFALFMNENADASIKLSKFCSLRPAHVKTCIKDVAFTKRQQLELTGNGSYESRKSVISGNDLSLNPV